MIKCATYPDNLIEDTPVTSALIAMVMIFSVVSSFPKLKFEHTCSFVNRAVSLFSSSNIYYGLVDSLGLYGTSIVEFGMGDTWTYALVILELVLINTSSNFLLKTLCRNTSSDLVSMISFFNAYNGLGNTLRNVIFWTSVVFYVVVFIFSRQIAKLEIPSEIVRFSIDIISAVFTSMINKSAVAESNAQKAEVDRQFSAAAMAINTPAPDNNSEN
jgi:hypothetical protein